MSDLDQDFLSDFYDEVENPLDAVEAYLLTTPRLYKRRAWDRLSFSSEGRFTEYRVEASYLPDDERVLISVRSNMIFDAEYDMLLSQLIRKINRGLTFGYFDVDDAGFPVFNHSLSLRHMDEQGVVEEVNQTAQQGASALDSAYPALSVMHNHLRRLSDAGFVLEMDDFLPAMNDDSPQQNAANNSFDFALMDVKGEG
jgi:hypothetical protein